MDRELVAAAQERQLNLPDTQGRRVDLVFICEFLNTDNSDLHVLESKRVCSLCSYRTLSGKLDNSESMAVDNQDLGGWTCRMAL